MSIIIIIENERDKRALDWLASQVGQHAIDKIVLAGNRKMYVSNIAKCLGLQIPDSITVTQKEKGLGRIQALRAAGLLRKI